MPRRPCEQSDVIAVRIDGDEFSKPLGMRSRRSGGGTEAKLHRVEVFGFEAEAPSAARLARIRAAHDGEPGATGVEQGVAAVIDVQQHLESERVAIPGDKLGPLGRAELDAEQGWRVVWAAHTGGLEGGIRQCNGRKVP